MRRALFLVLVIAACDKTAPPSSPTAPDVKAPAESADEPTPGSSEEAASLPPEVADAVNQALAVKFEPPAGGDPLQVWTSDFVTWSAKTKRPANDLAFQALDRAFNAATIDTERQVVLRAAGEFYEALALEMGGYQAQVQTQMSEGGQAPDMTSAYWQQAGGYYEACVGLDGPEREGCQAGLERAVQALQAAANAQP